MNHFRASENCFSFFSNNDQTTKIYIFVFNLSLLFSFLLMGFSCSGSQIIKASNIKTANNVGMTYYNYDR